MNTSTRSSNRYSPIVSNLSPTDRRSRLQKKLAAFAGESETSIYSSEDRLTPFPLDALLMIYLKAPRECYVDYMQGFKLLKNWLSPIISPKDYHCNICGKYELLGSYETQRIGELLGVNENIIIESILSIMAHEGDIL